MGLLAVPRSGGHDVVHCKANAWAWSAVCSCQPANGAAAAAAGSTERQCVSCPFRTHDSLCKLLRATYCSLIGVHCEAPAQWKAAWPVQVSVSCVWLYGTGLFAAAEKLLSFRGTADCGYGAGSCRALASEPARASSCEPSCSLHCIGLRADVGCRLPGGWLVRGALAGQLQGGCQLHRGCCL